MIAWTSTFDDYTTEIWATLYSPDAGWGPPERIASSKDYGGFGVTIAMDPDGAATVLWKGAAADLSSRDRTGLYVARREHGRAWGPPVMIDDVNLRPASVRLSAGASGRAMVVWYRWHAAIEGVRWTGSEWTAVETISPVTGDEPRELEVALDRSGNALVGWVDTEGGALTPGVLRVRRFIQ